MARKNTTLNPPPMDRPAIDRAIAALNELRASPRFKTQGEANAWAKATVEAIAKANAAQLKVRLPEPLRRQLEDAARLANRSMNAEIVSRLTRSFLQSDAAKIVANALVKNLDHDILNEIKLIFEQQRRDVKDNTLKREAESAADAHAEMMSDMDREGGPEEEEPK